MITYNIVFFSYLFFLIFWGTKKKPSFSSWHMFAGLNMMHFDLYFKPHDSKEENWKKLEPFLYLPHTHLSMSKNELKCFLVYLGKMKKIEVKGECTYFYKDKQYKLKIERNRIKDD